MLEIETNSLVRAGLMRAIVYVNGIRQLDKCSNASVASAKANASKSHFLQTQFSLAQNFSGANNNMKVFSSVPKSNANGIK